MSVKCFGLFWRRDEIDWNPGGGAKGGFRLLGHRYENKPVLRVADFCDQLGIYILYGNTGPYYVGLTKTGKLGGRLKNHTEDEHKEKWVQFSWFGFRRVLTGKDVNGLRNLGSMAEVELGNPVSDITDLEALLIRAMGLHNKNQPKFKSAEEWKQVKRDDVKDFMDKISN